MSNEDVFEVQRLYPQIYVACHNNHVRAVSTKWRISSQDASILVHLDRDVGTSPRSLARHLGVAPSTLSAAIARLAKLGYLTSEAADEDKRQRDLKLTSRGAEAISGASVLDAKRVALMLKNLTGSERKAAIKGLALLARAARQISD